MAISRQEYDQKPLAIQHGALLLWGTLVFSHYEGHTFRQLYSFSNFLAQVCFGVDRQKVTCICTFPAS